MSYEVLTPPKRAPLSLQPGEGPPSWTRYAEHPAYREMVRSAPLARRVAALAQFAKYFALVLAKRVLSYERIPAHLRRFDSPAAIGRFLREAARRRLLRLGAWRGELAATGERVLADLRAQGCSVIGMPPERYARLAAAAAPLVEGLRRSRGRREAAREFEESRAQALRTAHGELFAATEAILRESGVIDAVSAYLGHPAELIDINPQINDRSDDFWQRVFPDVKVEMPSTAYLHRDASGGDLKAIVYLSDVAADNGPFAYVLNSHRVETSRLGGWVEETNDHSGCSATEPKARERFAALPAALRRKCAFGNDLPSRSDAAARILDAEWSITAPRGHIVLFDTKGFHRGGMVLAGERVVATCVIG